MRLLALCSVVFLGVGCADSSVVNNGATGDITTITDTAVKDATVVDAAVVDTANEDTAVEDTAPPEDTGPGEGGFGWPCTGNGACNSGFCVPTSEGDQCTKTCDSDCPDGWACKPVGSDGDVTYICVDALINMCRPCLENNDCTGALGGVSLGSRCISYPGKGWFCGHACDDTDCPDGYSCQEVEDKSGEMSAQCVADAGECACSPYFIALGAQTWCKVENDYGTCMGTVECQSDGMSPCDAATPEAEICDLEDNDCDEAIDEEVPDEECVSEENDYGSCSGNATCVDGKMVCDAPEAAEEVCDGLDNNCSGAVDDGFDDMDADGLADCADDDDDGDGVLDESDNCPAVANDDQTDTDGDLLGDACDTDDDGDTVEDESDAYPLDPSLCGVDEDQDQCDDCAGGQGPNPADDGLDTDGDGLCDVGDTDDDGDTCLDEVDEEPLVASVDTDGDGMFDHCDADDDNDDVGDPIDSEPLNPNICGIDGDSDGCDDCFSGTNAPDNDGTDTDGDGACDVGDTDDDNDGALDPDDSDDTNPNICSDADGDTCDDCSSGVFNVSADGTDTDGDGLCDAGDNDDDNDTCPDDVDEAPLVASGDNDGDGTFNDCDTDDDNDGALDPDDSDDANSTVCSDTDSDGCDDCVSGTFNPKNDGTDTDGDGLCNAGDSDDDNDGVGDNADCKPLDKATALCNEKSCKVIKQKFPGSKSGVFTIDVDGDNKGKAPEKVYCDMTTHGGGWTALLNPTGVGLGKTSLGAYALHSAGCPNCTNNIFGSIGGGWNVVGIYRCGACAASSTLEWKNTLGAKEVMYTAYAHGVANVDIRVDQKSNFSHTGCGIQQRFATSDGAKCGPNVANGCGGGAWLAARVPRKTTFNQSVLRISVLGSSGANIAGGACSNPTGWGGGGRIMKVMVR